MHHNPPFHICLFCGFLSPSHVLTNAALKISSCIWRTWLFNTFAWSSSLQISLVWYLMSNWFSTEFHSMGRNIFNSLDQLSWKPTYHRPSFLLPEPTSLYQSVSKSYYFSLVSAFSHLTNSFLTPFSLAMVVKITMIGLHLFVVVECDPHMSDWRESWSSKRFGQILKNKTWEWMVWGPVEFGQGTKNLRSQG